MFPNSFGAVVLNTEIEHRVDEKSNPIVQLYLRQDGITVSVGLMYEDEMIPVRAWLDNPGQPNVDDLEFSTEDVSQDLARQLRLEGSTDVTGYWYSFTPPRSSSLCVLLEYLTTLTARSLIKEFLTEWMGEEQNVF